MILPAALLALLLVWPRTARADGALIVVGDVTPRDREVVADMVKLEATALSYRFNASLFSREAADAAMACLRDRTPWSCIAPTIRGKDQLVIVEISSDRSAGAPMTIVTVHLLAAGAEAESFATRNCAMCNEEALKRTVGDLSRDLLQRAAARTGRTKLVIRSRPGGAQLTLDGRSIGATDDGIPTYPGTHTIVAQLPGREPATKEVTAIDGQTTRVSIDLAPARPQLGDQDQPSRFLPGLAVGFGAGAIAAGGVLIWMIQSPNGRQQPEYYDPARLGLVSLAAGAAVTGIGVYFLMRSRTTSIATIAPVPGGATIGWAGRF